MTEVLHPRTITFNQEGDVPANNGADDKSTQFGRDKSLRDSSVDVFRTCADPGNNRSIVL